MIEEPWLGLEIVQDRDVPVDLELAEGMVLANHPYAVDRGGQAVGYMADSSSSPRGRQGLLADAPRPLPRSCDARSRDPILASVLQRRVHAITQEMATVLMRSSRSPIFNEIGDLVTVVFDAEGRTLAQTEYASIIANGAGPPLPIIIERFAGDLHDGDVIIHNDVYTGGNQYADVGIYVPVFHGGELVAWTASKGHVADIGGMTPGGYDPNAREVWQEAFRIPPLKLVDAGVLRQDVWELVSANIRLDIVMEDIKSMIGACTIGKRRLLRGARPLRRRDVRPPHGRGDRGVRAPRAGRDRALARRRLPRRELDGLGRDRPDAARYRIAVEITVAGSEITFDFSRHRRPGAGLHEHAAGLGDGRDPIAFLMLINAGGIDVPTNAGLFAPMHDRLPRGLAALPALPGRRRSSATRCATRSSRRSCSRSPSRSPTA